MERPRFSPYAVPEAPGSMNEIVSHASSFYVQHREELTKLIKLIEKGDLLPWKNQLESLLKYLKELKTTDSLDFQEQISQDEKERTFNPAIEKMKSFATQHGITLPNNLIQRITILNEETTSYIHQAFDPKHKDNNNEAFTTIKYRLSFINNDAVTQTSAETGVKKENLMREAGIHELWHSVEYTEIWLADNSASSKLESLRRSGMITSRPDKIQGNYRRLEEGFIQYLTRETLKLLNEPLYSDIFYKEELELIDTLIGQIGLDPLIQATFSKKGFRSLFNALEQRFGKSAFAKIGETLKKDWGIFLIKSFEGNTLSPRYPITKKFLQRKKSLTK